MAKGPPANPEGSEAIARRLRALRSAKGMTQLTMSRMLGSATSGQLWANYEAREPGMWKRIGLNSALRLCHQFGVTLEWIYRGDTRLLDPKLADELRAHELMDDRSPS